jgi:hypothetical protein
VQRVVDALDVKYADFQDDGLDGQLSPKRSGQG